MRDKDETPDDVEAVPASWAAVRAMVHEIATAAKGAHITVTPRDDAPHPFEAIVNTPPVTQEFPAFGDAWSKHERRIEANEPNYLCFPCDDTGRMFDVECPWCPRCDSDSCLTPDGQRTPIRQQFGLHLCNPHTGNRWCNVACLRASGLDDCYDNHARSVLLATVWGEAWHRPFRPTEVASRIACYTPLLEELTQYAQAALASLRPTEGTP